MTGTINFIETCHSPEPDEAEVGHQHAKLFIDVDGVLFADYGGQFQLRPYVSSFLKWAQELFDCYWLTAWDSHALSVLFSELYITPNIKYAEWGLHKTEAILNLAEDGNFFWLDDSALGEELEVLDAHGWVNKLITVKFRGRDGLNHAIKELCQRANIAEPSFLTEE